MAKEHPSYTICKDIDSTLAAPYGALGESIMARLGYPASAYPEWFQQRLIRFKQEEIEVAKGRKKRMYEKGTGENAGYTVFLAQPGEAEVVRFAEAEYLQAWKEALRDWELHGQFPMLHNANTGTDLLLVTTGFDQGGYFTARKENEAGAMAAATRQWLTKNGFRNPEDVTVCVDVTDKLMRIMERHLIQGTGVNADMNVVLVDDRADELAQMLALFRSGEVPNGNTAYTTAAERFNLVAFGSTEEAAVRIETQYQVPVFALPNWEKDSVLQLVSTVKTRLI